jgi:membrane-associated phospholipid phosphatase
VSLGLSLLLLGAPHVAGQSPSSAPPTTALSDDRDVSIRQLPGNIIEDQKRIWTFPFKPKAINHWWPLVIVLGVGAGFVASDPYTAPHFLNTTNFHGYSQVFSSTNSAAMIAAVPTAFYGIGWLRKDSYAQNSALLAGEAALDVFLLDLPMKSISARRQPLSYSGNGPYSDSFFNGSHNPFHSGGFYSDHAALAMAVATVVAHRYRNHRWVPIAAYALAGAISFSRVTTNNHFASDAFFGAAMGFVVAHYAVLPAR